MNMLVLSDIHGSASAARFLRQVTEEKKPEYIILLGDILYHGPRNPLPGGYDPAAVVETLSPLAGEVIAVRGNCDSEVDAEVLPFPLARDFIWLTDKGLRICATHGHIHGPHNPPALKEGDMLLSGHTHVPTARTTSQGIHFCNPGSIALPKEGHPPTYGWIDSHSFSVFTKDGELYLQLAI